MIVTNRLDLQPFTLDTAAAIAEGPSSAAGFPREDDRDAARMFLQAPNDQFGSYQIKLRKSEEAIGTIGFFGPPDDKGDVMIGYGLVESARGNGYATEAVIALVEYAFAQPGVARIVADSDVDNVASHRVLEKAGFVPQPGRPGSFARPNSHLT